MLTYLYQAFLRAPQGEGCNTVASALLARLDKRRRKRRSEAVNAIDFTHSSWLLAFHAIDQWFLTFFGLFPDIEFYYDQISYPTILVNVNMRHFIMLPIGVERLTEHPKKLQLLYYIEIHQSKTV